MSFETFCSQILEKILLKTVKEKKKDYESMLGPDESFSSSVADLTLMKCVKPMLLWHRALRQLPTALPVRKTTHRESGFFFAFPFALLSMGYRLPRKESNKNKCVLKQLLVSTS